MQFGDDDDDQSPSPRNRDGTSPDTPVSPGSSRSPNPLEYPEEDAGDQAPVEHTWASIPFPKWDGLKPTDGKVRPRQHLGRRAVTARSGADIHIRYGR